MTVLAEPGMVTLPRLQEALRQPIDILYLVCRGAVGPSGPQLWLEHEDGTAHRVHFDQFLRLLGEHVPRLVILGSCYSGGDSGEPGAFLGPLLAEAGVPAVLAFDGLLRSETLDLFISGFFRELRRSGRLEQAVSTARRDIQMQEWEWPQPVLHSRHTEEEILLPVRDAPAEPGAFPRWPMLLESINERRCIPFAGWDCDAGVFGTEAEVAAVVADEFDLPIHTEDVRRFWEVARILVATQGTEAALAAIRKALLARARELDPGAEDTDKEPVGEAVRRLSRAQRARDPDHPLDLIAELPAKFFFTTSWFPTLRDALHDAGRPPATFVPPWNEAIPLAEARAEPPTAERPLVIHLSGLWSIPESLVLTDDDHMLFAAALGENRDILPEDIRGRARAANLLVCGSDVSDPMLRMLLQAFHRWTPAARRRNARHVVVHPEPALRDDQDPKRAQAYVTDYLNDLTALPYWGAAPQFARELRLQRSTQ